MKLVLLVSAVWCIGRTKVVSAQSVAGGESTWQVGGGWRRETREGGGSERWMAGRQQAARFHRIGTISRAFVYVFGFVFVFTVTAELSRIKTWWAFKYDEQQNWINWNLSQTGQSLEHKDDKRCTIYDVNVVSSTCKVGNADNCLILSDDPSSPCDSWHVQIRGQSKKVLLEQRWCTAAFSLPILCTQWQRNPEINQELIFIREFRPQLWLLKMQNGVRQNSKARPIMCRY